MNIYLFEHKGNIDENTFQKLYNNLPTDRKIKAEKIKSTLTKEISILAYYVVKYAVQKEKGINNFEITLSEKGKPLIEGNHFYFNLSHTKNLIICAVDDKPIGVDIEEIRDYNQKTADRVCSEKELELLSVAADDEVRAELFCKMWVQKEAYSKMTGNGFSEGFDRINTTDNKKCQWKRLNAYYIGIAAESIVNDINIIKIINSKITVID